jgi:hypothetical protein
MTTAIIFVVKENDVYIPAPDFKPIIKTTLEFKVSNPDSTILRR